MPYNRYLAERIERILSDRKATFCQKPMMVGLVFMGDDKMCVGTARDKKPKELECIGIPDKS